MNIFVLYIYAVLMYIAIFFAILSLPVVAYVFHSLGYQTIAKRRWIKDGWLSWLPIGVLWIQGCISDQYQYVVKGKVTNRRKVLLWSNIGILLACLLFLITYLLGLNTSRDAYEVLGVMFLIAAISMLAILVLTVLMLVFYYISLYDLYRSCDPGNSVLYLVLSLVLPYMIPIFVFACRKKELGMPPRKRPAPKPDEETVEN